MGRASAVGLDLSLAGLGVCAVPLDWDLRPELVRAKTLGVSLSRGASVRDHTLRLMALARDVRTVLVYYGARHVAIEDIGHFGRSKAATGIELAELRGVIRVELEQIGIEPHFVGATDARTLLYGQDVPRRLTPTNRKSWLFEPLKLCGLPLADHNQGDAFAVANWMLSEIGAPCLAGLLAPKAAE
ncbi:MAG TPA: hypothetical protein VIM73_23240 [Polyangiaceae bacterium]